MDIEYGCYVSNRYDDFLNVSENESQCRNDGIIANGKQQNKTKQRKKKKSKRVREQLDGEKIESVIEKEHEVADVVNGMIEKPLEIAVIPAMEIVTEMMEPAQQTETADAVEQISSNVPAVEQPNDASAKPEAIEDSAEVKWSQICIEEDKAVAEQQKLVSENGKRKLYATVCFYNSNFGNGNRFVRLGENFRARPRDKMVKIAKDDRTMVEKSESEQTESVNDCNNNDVDGKSDQVNSVSKKRKHTKKRNRKRAAKVESAADENASEAVVNGDTAQDGNMIHSGDATPAGDSIRDGDSASIGERKAPIRKRRNNKFQRMHKSNSNENHNSDQVIEQPHTSEQPMEKQKEIIVVSNDSNGHASPKTNNNNSPAARTVDHIHAEKTAYVENVNKPKRSRFGRRKRTAVPQNIEWTKKISIYKFIYLFSWRG